MEVEPGAAVAGVRLHIRDAHAASPRQQGEHLCPTDRAVVPIVSVDIHRFDPHLGPRRTARGRTPHPPLIDQRVAEVPQQHGRLHGRILLDATAGVREGGGARLVYGGATLSQTRGSEVHMGFERIEVEPITNVLGATVRGVDLREPLDEETVRELSDAWLEHKVLFLHDQPLTHDQHRRFAQSFGDIYQHPFLKTVGKEPDFVMLYSGGDTGSRYVAEGWHTDVTFSPQPPMGSILRAVEVPAYGGDTMWIDLEPHSWVCLR